MATGSPRLTRTDENFLEANFTLLCSVIRPNGKQIDELNLTTKNNVNSLPLVMNTSRDAFFQLCLPQDLYCDSLLLLSIFFSRRNKLAAPMI